LIKPQQAITGMYKMRSRLRGGCALLEGTRAVSAQPLMFLQENF